MQFMNAVRVAALTATLLPLGSCAGEREDGAEIAQAEEALFREQPRRIYLRCASSHWQMNEATRLVEDQTTGLLTLDYEVKWLRDSCVFTASYDWLHANFGAKRPVRVPGGGQLHTFFGFALPFRVTYPALGNYRATVDFSARRFRFDEAEPAVTEFSPIEYFGDAQNYLPLHEERWAVVDDLGELRYGIVTSDYAEGPDGTLGEYSLIEDRSYGDFMVRALARSDEDLALNPNADFALVYGFVDERNYSYMLFSANWERTTLVRVEEGSAHVIAGSPVPAFSDTGGYHTIELWRHGSWLRAVADGTVLISVNDPAPPLTGAIGVGSLDDAVLFDDLDVVHYLDRDTPHFHVTMPSSYAAYEDSVLSLLENAYVINLENTGWDINQRMGHSSYEYLYRPSGWVWFNDANGCCVLGGGLTISGGPSAVVSELIPQSKLPASDSFNPFVAITLHELGNGWFLPGATQPEWVEWLRSESHSGFLRAEVELDMGYCADANREHDAHYDDYLATSLDDRRLRGNSVEPLLVSLRERYGWGIFRAVYDATLSGELDYLATISSDERDNEMVVFLSQHAGESLIGFFERELGVNTSEATRAALGGLPESNLTVLSDLPCHVPTLRATPDVIELTASASAPVASSLLYAQAPSPWQLESAAPASWLRLERVDTSDATTIRITADASGLGTGTHAADIVLVGDALRDSPLHVPVLLHVE